MKKLFFYVDKNWMNKLAEIEIHIEVSITLPSRVVRSKAKYIHIKGKPNEIEI